MLTIRLNHKAKNLYPVDYKVVVIILHGCNPVDYKVVVIILHGCNPLNTNKNWKKERTSGSNICRTEHEAKGGSPKDLKMFHYV